MNLNEEQATLPPPRRLSLLSGLSRLFSSDNAEHADGGAGAGGAAPAAALRQQHQQRRRSSSSNSGGGGGGGGGGGMSSLGAHRWHPMQLATGAQLLPLPPPLRLPSSEGDSGGGGCYGYGYGGGGGELAAAAAAPPLRLPPLFVFSDPAAAPSRRASNGLSSEGAGPGGRASRDLVDVSWLPPKKRERSSSSDGGDGGGTGGRGATTSFDGFLSTWAPGGTTTTGGGGGDAAATTTAVAPVASAEPEATAATAMPSSLFLSQSYHQQLQRNLAPIPGSVKGDESEEEKRHRKKKQKKDDEGTENENDDNEEGKGKSRRTIGTQGRDSRSPVTPPKEENTTTARQQQKSKKRGEEEEAEKEKATTADNALLVAAAFSSPPPAAIPPPPTSSSYRGVSCHRSTRRWEASIWLGRRQAYLGGFEVEEDAARSYDLASLACRGRRARQPGATNFPPEEYAGELNALAQAAGVKEKFDFASSSSSTSSSFPVLPIDLVVAHVRRRSTAFARGRSPFRGVSGEEGRWEARIGGLFGRKNVSLGVLGTEDDAARAYDRALIVEKGRSAKTNFPITDYDAEVAECIASGMAGETETTVAAIAAAAVSAALSAGGNGSNKKNSSSSSSSSVPPVLLRPPAPAATITLAQLAAALKRQK